MDSKFKTEIDMDSDFLRFAFLNCVKICVVTILKIYIYIKVHYKQIHFLVDDGEVKAHCRQTLS